VYEKMVALSTSRKGIRNEKNACCQNWNFVEIEMLLVGIATSML